MVASASAVGIFGANWSVVQALASVNFLPGSFGEMQGSVAYIRRWSRRGTADTSQPLQPSSFDFVSRDSVNEGLSAQLRSRLPVLNFNPLSQDAITGPNFSATAPNLSSFFPTSANAQQAFAPNFSQTAPVPPLGTQLPPAPRASFGRLLGQIFSANPSGQFFGAFAPRTSTPYTGKAAPRRVPSTQLGWSTFGGTVGSIPVTSSLPPGQWQFLFNPSELQIDAGPEFQKAETWGVSDKANSGQPLHWTHNKNVELKFNEVLLNGYVFGKQVESLEQGLFDLFMARGDRSQAGPDILEFVWGKRVFGPCVIKNVSVKEKAWDNGLVVNATVSFTLEQIPEWTINDGEFVDVARPGREAFIGNPSVPSPNTLASESPAEPEQLPAPTPPPPTPAPAPSGNTSQQKPPTSAPRQLDGNPANFFPQSECDAGRRTAANFDRVASGARTGLGGFVFGVGDGAAVAAVNNYVNIYTSFATVLNTLPLASPCKNKCSYTGQAANNNRDLSCARDCSTQAANLLRQRYSNTKCLASTAGVRN